MDTNTQAKIATASIHQSKLTEVATTHELLRTALALSLALCCFYH